MIVAEKANGNSSRVEICDCANEADSGVFGQVEGDDIISFAQLLIDSPLVLFLLDLRRT